MIRNRLKKIMDERGVRIVDLHRELGISRPTITSMIKNEPTSISLDILDKLCNYFEITPNDFFEVLPFDNFDFYFYAKPNPESDLDHALEEAQGNALDEIRQIEEEEQGVLTNWNREFVLLVETDNYFFEYKTTATQYLPGEPFSGGSLFFMIFEPVPVTESEKNKNENEDIFITEYDMNKLSIWESGKKKGNSSELCKMWQRTSSDFKKDMSEKLVNKVRDYLDLPKTTPVVLSIDFLNGNESES